MYIYIIVALPYRVVCLASNTLIFPSIGLPVPWAYQYPRQPVSSIESSTVRTDLSSTHQLRPRLNGKEVRAEMMDLRSHKLSLGSMGVTSSVNPTGLLRPPLATDIAHTATQSFTDT